MHNEHGKMNKAPDEKMNECQTNANGAVRVSVWTKSVWMCVCRCVCLCVREREYWDRKIQSPL